MHKNPLHESREIVICGLLWDNADDAAHDLHCTPVMVKRFMNGNVSKATEDRISDWAMKMRNHDCPDEELYHHADLVHCNCSEIPIRGRCGVCKFKNVSIYDVKPNPVMKLPTWD